MAENQRILCVDDEPMVLEALERTLSERFDVTAISSPLEALEVLKKQEPFAVVVSDMRMPHMDGSTFLARAYAIAPDTTRMLLTGQVDIQAAIAAVNKGQIFRFLCKPCPSDELGRAIEAGIAQYRLITSERELLEQTLTGSIRLLNEVLSLVAPSVFARSERIRAYVVHMARRLGLKDLWRFELAGALSMIGCVGLPEQTLERVLSGRPLDAEERRAFEEHPASAYRLLSKIARFQEVAEIVRRQSRSPGLPAGSRDVEIGAALLRIAREADRVVDRGGTVQDALDEVRSRVEENERPLVAALSDFRAGGATTVRPFKVQQLASGMVLEQDVKTTAGVIVVPKGRALTSVLIERLWKFASAGTLVEPVLARAPEGE
jgi:CheY-like chemotaxis protein